MKVCVGEEEYDIPVDYEITSGYCNTLFGVIDDVEGLGLLVEYSFYNCEKKSFYFDRTPEDYERTVEELFEEIRNRIKLEIEESLKEKEVKIVNQILIGKHWC